MFLFSFTKINIVYIFIKRLKDRDGATLINYQIASDWWTVANHNCLNQQNKRTVYATREDEGSKRKLDHQASKESKKPEFGNKKVINSIKVEIFTK